MSTVTIKLRQGEEVELTGNYDAQLHPTGVLVIVETVPCLDPANTTGVKQSITAMYNSSQWESVEVK